jgi:hypothetical protein
MGSREKRELSSIKSELRSLISELDQVAHGMNSDFSGVGNDRCSQSISSVANQCRSSLQRMNSIDLSLLDD